FLDDYAFLVQALLALHDASGKMQWRDAASQVARVMIQKFGDGQAGLFFTASDAADLIVRQKTASDSPLPSGNAIAALTMLELDQPQIARQTIEAFASQLEQQAEGM